MCIRDRRWEGLLAVRDEVTRVLEEARQKKQIGSSLEAALTLWAAGDLYRLLEQYREKLAEIFIVSTVELCEGLEQAPPEAEEGQELPLKLSVAGAVAVKCPRCWIFAAAADGELCPRCRALLG